MTDPTGRCFLSYRRKRSHEAKLLVLALHDVGVPAWQDIKDLDSEPTEEELRRVLDDPSTSSALLWVTPEIVDSPVIRKIEIPKVIERRRAGDGFFVQPVAAGGLDYDQAGAVASEHLGVDDLTGWNLEKTHADPIDAADAAHVAELVLRRRIKEIATRLEPTEPLQLSVHTRCEAPFVSGTALALNWCERFDRRVATAETWDDRLLPALTVVSTTVRQVSAGRPVEASGLLAIPAALALGAAFLAPGGTDLRWRQAKAGRTDQLWSLNAERETSTLAIDVINRDLSSQDAAVVVSINHDAEEALRRSASDVPTFRGYVRARGPDGVADLATPGQAADAAFRLVEQIHNARRQWQDIRRLHFFIAGPAGFAVLVGQLLNGLGPVRTYEHIPTDAVGVYRRAALINPGM